MVYGTIVEVFLQKLSQWYCDASPEAPSPEYTGSADYRSSAPDGSPQGPSSHLTVADHRRPDAVSSQSALGPLQKWETQSSFIHGKSECGLVKIPRYAQDDSVDIRIEIILKGPAVRLHARSARRWGSLGSCPKRVVFRHRGLVFFGVVPEKGGFQARYRLHSALLSPSVQSEEGYLQRCGKVHFNFAAPQQ